MKVSYWIVAAVLVSLYLYSGALKVARSREQLRPMMGWVDSMPMSLVRTIGVLELLGALGLLLPPLTGIAPVLAPAAAVGLVLVQVGATVLHVRRHEFRDLWLNGVLIVLAGVTVWLSTVWL